ncbi:unnamed protein product [Trichogramma brassicae]|uniref:Uncharacterized protein n=1 Tax=Trichogramma brassicae TaxID=86971 RepID=A0A6H5IWR5_9HYME|nr:unnamed protein product [Trichogramma brassicae]
MVFRRHNDFGGLFVLGRGPLRYVRERPAAAAGTTEEAAVAARSTASTPLRLVLAAAADSLLPPALRVTHMGTGTRENTELSSIGLATTTTTTTTTTGSLTTCAAASTLCALCSRYYDVARSISTRSSDRWTERKRSKTFSIVLGRIEEENNVQNKRRKLNTLVRKWIRDTSIGRNMPANVADQVGAMRHAEQIKMYRKGMSIDVRYLKKKDLAQYVPASLLQKKVKSSNGSTSPRNEMDLLSRKRKSDQDFGDSADKKRRTVEDEIFIHIPSRITTSWIFIAHPLRKELDAKFHCGLIAKYIYALRQSHCSTHHNWLRLYWNVLEH